VLRITAAVRRCVVLAAAVLVSAASLTTASPAATAWAGPGPVITAAGDDEGGSDSLREQLDTASRGYLDAKAKLEHSQQRQKELTASLGTVESELVTRTATISELAGAAYRVGPLAPMSALLAIGSADTLLDGVAYVDVLAARQDRQIKDLVDTRTRVSTAKAAVDAELAEQQRQLAVMAQRKQQAERALLAVGGEVTGGYASTGSVLARPAPRNPDGSWPTESCVVDDPTTSGCITARTLHAMRQAQAAGFTHYVSCHRNGGSGEHPKGRACDFAAAKNGFAGTATGAERTYGNNLAAFFLRNASRLGVLYVIWYRQIWLPSSGWRAYHGGGDPASDHTNHVHLSVI
jgi:hypothetical protein